MAALRSLEYLDHTGASRACSLLPTLLEVPPGQKHSVGEIFKSRGLEVPFGHEFADCYYEFLDILFLGRYVHLGT